jgi:Protein of unknown function (DUF4232)
VRKPISAVAIAVLLAAGCSSAPVPSAERPPTPLPGITPGTSVEAGYVDVEAADVAYSGEAVPFAISGSAPGNAVIRLPIAHVAIDFGDQMTAALDSDCGTGSGRLTTSHVYAAAGDYQIDVTAIVACGTVPLAGGEARGIWILGAPSAGAATWPACASDQLSMAARDLGTMMNQGEVIVTLRNRSTAPCRLTGYPSVELRRGTMSLPTTDRHAVSGGYQFPPVPVHLVGIEPGASASFEIAYLGIPITDQPQDVACPRADALRVTLPDSVEYGTAALALAPCNGILDVTPIFPGSERVPFP